jgi:uncharacterized repeat protein (TIGR03803 family)
VKWKQIVPAITLVYALGSFAPAQTFATLHNFTEEEGFGPYAGVIQGPSGNLYATASYGGDPNCDRYGDGCGTVYEMNTAGTETVLYSFLGSPNGKIPYMPLARDKAGNLYGTTFEGGGSGFSDGWGTVFKIDTAGNETLLHKFNGSSDGCYPWQGLVADASGALFGTTWECGAAGNGTIFKVDSTGSFTVLHNFAGYPSDGANPQLGHLTIDKSGNLYGVTTVGGSEGDGALYELNTSGKLTLLHSFKGSDGCNPFGSVMGDIAGNLYGTTGYCGSHDDGTIWKVSRGGKETTLHQFAGGASDGCNPVAGVSRDSKGNLYGVTSGCGAHGNYGALYELSASGKLTLLHSFDGSDGTYPYGEVLRTTNGKLFGTTYAGGNNNCPAQYGCGTVWSYAP